MPSYLTSFFAISHHAVQQYRERVVACPERRRSNKTLRSVIDLQVRLRPWELAGGETFIVKGGPLVPKRKTPWEMKVSCVTHTFVIECQTVVTVLGFMMQPNKRAIQRRRRRQRLAELAQ